MALIFKLLPHSNLTSVETFPIMTVDWLRGGRPAGEGGREGRRKGREGGRGSGKERRRERVEIKNKKFTLTLQ